MKPATLVFVSGRCLQPVTSPLPLDLDPQLQKHITRRHVRAFRGPSQDSRPPLPSSASSPAFPANHTQPWPNEEQSLKGEPGMKIYFFSVCFD